MPRACADTWQNLEQELWRDLTTRIMHMRVGDSTTRACPREIHPGTTLIAWGQNGRARYTCKPGNDTTNQGK
eukprot:12815841-Alexandrium_andersonii.AAC.1